MTTLTTNDDVTLKEGDVMTVNGQTGTIYFLHDFISASHPSISFEIDVDVDFPDNT